MKKGVILFAVACAAYGATLLAAGNFFVLKKLKQNMAAESLTNNSGNTR